MQYHVKANILITAIIYNLVKPLPQQYDLDEAKSMIDDLAKLITPVELVDSGVVKKP